MDLSPATPRLALPLLVAGQAQKEVTHNEALMRLDVAVGGSLTTGPASVPPTDPAIGACWIVGPGAGGAWAGHAQAVAAWTVGGWRFVDPWPGMTVSITDGGEWRFDGTGWAGPAALALPIGGAVIDEQARTMLTDLRNLLIERGFIEG